MGVHFPQLAFSTLNLTLATGPSPGVRELPAPQGTHLVSQQLPYLAGLQAESEQLSLQGKAALLPVDAGHLHLDFCHCWSPGIPGSTLRKGRWRVRRRNEREGGRAEKAGCGKEVDPSSLSPGCPAAGPGGVTASRQT